MIDTLAPRVTGEQRFLAALRHEQPDATPVWFMRQAGRSLAEYRELRDNHAVIGFSGSPFTLACYLIEGRPSRDYAMAKAFMYAQPASWHSLLEKLSTVVIRY